MKYDVGVIGGGVIGLSCAWKMAQRGAKVALFERGKIGREASFAAAGMLAAQCEAAHHPPLANPISDSPVNATCLENGDENFACAGAKPAHEYSCEAPSSAAMFDLCLQSRTLYPAFAAELFDLTGIDIELSLSNCERGDWRTPGILYVATRDDDAAPQALEAQQAQGHRVVKRDFRDRCALWLPDEGQVNNRVLVQALRRAASSAGVAIYESERIRVWPQALRGVDLRGSQREVHLENSSTYTSGQRFEVAKTLLCAGAWSSEINPSVSVPVRPVAGEMLSLKADHRVKSIIYGSDVYLVPRRNGSLLVGATMKEDGFRKRVTPRGVLHLLKSACELVPELEHCAILDQWAGIRPASPDGLPMLGRSEMENFFIATGHFRNGILLAPATAQIMADCVLDSIDAPEAFGLARFSQANQVAAKRP